MVRREGGEEEVALCLCPAEFSATHVIMAAAGENVDLDVDSVIEKLLEVRGQRPGKQVQLSENEIRALCIKSREIFLQQPILLELQVCRCCG